MNEYPKFLYSAEGSKLVRNAGEEGSLPGAWFDSPEKVPMPKSENKLVSGSVELAAQQDDASAPQESARPKLGRPFKVK